MENTAPCGDFGKIVADLESENLVANVSAVNQASALIAGGKIPEPQLLCRLIAGLASNLEKPDHDSAIKRCVSFTLKAIRVAVIKNRMNMDSSARGEALHAIWCCFMDQGLRRIQRDSNMVRLWTVQDQLSAVKIICTFFRLSPVNISDTRCVTAFASLMLSPYSTVVCACADALLSLPPVVPGFSFAIARAYCHMLATVSPQSPLEVSSMVAMLGRLKQVSTTMVHHPGFSDLAVDVLAALSNCNLAVRKNLLNLMVRLLTPRNISAVLLLLDNELNRAANIHIEYHKMLEEAIRECHAAFPGCIVEFTLDPKYSVFIDSILYIIDIMNPDQSLRGPLLKGLLRALRHVKSPLDLLDRRKIEKLILGGEAENQYKLSTDYYGVTAGDATQGKHQQPWLMEMEELLFVRIGLTRQAGGSYAIPSSSKSSASSSNAYLPEPLGNTDNLIFLVHSGDALLADFVEIMLSNLKKKVKELE
uniref:Coatomer subunit beta-1 n=1 Tax=Zea mays TaxID=4577 RepID=A0A804RH87_MAIZE